MQGTAAQTERQLSADDVIEYLRADYWVRSGIDPEVDAGDSLERSTSIFRWRAAIDLIPPDSLVHVMDGWLGTDCGADAWRAVLEPEDTRTLGDLADFVAAHAVWPDFEPLRIGGTLDPASGAFFALRGMLARAGVPVAHLRPSTSVEAVARVHLYPLANAVTRLAPAIVLVPRLVRSTSQRVGTGFLVIGVIALAFTVWHPTGLMAAAAMVALLVGAAVCRASFAAVELGTYATFADLARAIAASRLGAV